MTTTQPMQLVSNGSLTTPFFDRPAVFISAISPGYVGGGSQCALAFLQAVSQLHAGQVIYLGPAYLPSEPPVDVPVQKVVKIPSRGWWQRLQGLARFGSVDRATPAAVPFLDALSEGRPDSVVYVNGEVAGHVVRLAQRRKLNTVFICQNYAPEYLAAETRWHDFARRGYAMFASRSAIAGYRTADFCVTLTQEDRDAYLNTSGRTRPRATNLSSCYFGYQEPDETLTAGESNLHAGEFTVLVNTNMALSQNAEGVLFLLRDVWPRLQRETDWRLVLAGRYPTADIHAAVRGCDRVELIVRPEPRKMEEIFRRSSVCIASTFKGSGIKLRVAEGLRRGLPVMSTEHCARGYEQISADVLRVFRSAEELIAHLQDLASGSRESLRKSAIEQYRQFLSFEAGLRKLSALGELAASLSECDDLPRA